MDTVAIKVSVNGEMRRIPQNPFDAGFDYKSLLALAGVSDGGFLQVFYYDEEGDKIMVSSDAELKESVRAQNLGRFGRQKNRYFRIFLNTKPTRAHRSFPPRYRCSGPRVRPAEFTSDDAWDRMISLLRLVAPLVPGLRAVLDSPKIEELKDSEEVQAILSLVEDDLKRGANPVSILFKLNGSEELKNLKAKLEAELPDLASCAAEDKNNAVHYGVVCDGCNQNPIRGLRFKCRDCNDFDFCSACRFQTPHDATHSFDTVDAKTFFNFPGFVQGGCGPFECFPKENDPKEAKEANNNAEKSPASKQADEVSEAKDGSATENPWKEKEESNDKEKSERSTDDEYEVVPEDQEAAKEDDVEKKFERELQILKDMGFNDQDQLVRLLRGMDGNLRNVLQALFAIKK